MCVQRNEKDRIESITEQGNENQYEMQTHETELHRNRFKTKSKSLSALINRASINNIFNTKNISPSNTLETQQIEQKSPTILSPTFITPTLSPTPKIKQNKRRKNTKSSGTPNGELFGIELDVTQKKKILSKVKTNHDRVYWLAQTNYHINHIQLKGEKQRKMVECPYDIHSNKYILEIILTYNEYSRLLMEQIISMICCESVETLHQIEWYKLEMKFLLECYELWRVLIPELEIPILTTEYRLENYREITRSILQIEDPMQSIQL